MTAKKDILEQVAIVQNDRESYAIVPHIPGGITNTETLRKLADVGDKYGCKLVKVTSAQRIALVGISEEDIAGAYEDLGMDMGQAIGNCVRSIKICPGKGLCKRAQQDSVGLGLELDRIYHGMDLPSKLKMGVSGCPNSCSENSVKEIGIMGKAKGFTMMVGGNAGLMPRLGTTIYTDLTAEQVLEKVAIIIDFYKKTAKKKERLFRVLERTDMDTLKNYIEGDENTRSEIVDKILSA